MLHLALGKKIRLLRIQNNMTQSFVAASLKCRSPHILEWSEGRHLLGLEKLTAFVNYSM